MDTMLFWAVIILLPSIGVAAFLLFVVSRLQSFFSYNPYEFQDGYKKRKSKRYQYLLGKIHKTPSYANTLSSRKIQELIEYLNYSLYDLISSGRYHEHVTLSLTGSKNISRESLRWLYRTARSSVVQDAILSSGKLSEQEKIMMALQRKAFNK